MFNIAKLPKDSDENISKLSRYVVKMVGFELGNLNRPCNKLKFVIYWKDLVYLTGLTPKELDIFISEFPDKPIYKYRPFVDKYNLLIVECIFYFIKMKNYDMAKNFYYLLAIKYYSNIVSKFFPKYCYPQIWRLALDRLSFKHLFKQKDGIGNAILYLVDEEFNKKIEAVSKNKIDDEFNFIFQTCMSLRHRIAQSFKPLAQICYKMIEDEGMTAGESNDDLTDTQEDDTNVLNIIDKVTFNICVYSQKDIKLIKIACKKSGLKQELGNMIVNEISKPDRRENIHLIYLLLNKIVSLKLIGNEKERLALVRKVNANVNVHTYKVKDFIKNFILTLSTDYTLKTIDPNQLVIFLTHYLTLYYTIRYNK